MRIRRRPPLPCNAHVAACGWLPRVWGLPLAPLTAACWHQSCTRYPTRTLNLASCWPPARLPYLPQSLLQNEHLAELAGLRRLEQLSLRGCSQLRCVLHTACCCACCACCHCLCCWEGTAELPWLHQLGCQVIGPLCWQSLTDAEVPPAVLGLCSGTGLALLAPLSASLSMLNLSNCAGLTGQLAAVALCVRRAA